MMKYLFLTAVVYCVLLIPLTSLSQEIASIGQVTHWPSVQQNSSPLKLRDALVNLGKRHGISILFDESTVKNRMVENVKARETSKFESQLESLLKPHGLRFKRMGKKSFVILPNAVVSLGTLGSRTLIKEGDEGSSSLTLGAIVGMPREHFERMVAGRITDERGEGLPGVSVIVKGTGIGTTTQVDGTYKIAVPEGDVRLIFSFVGYITREESAGNRSEIDLEMKVDTKALDEVVVTSFGIEREKKALFYATQEVKGAQLTAVGNPNLLNSLQGKVAGVSVRLNSGMPGKAPQITIRGNRSITGNNQPLYVIDGLPVAGGTRINDLNPNDIESMNVLKGPAASALYGLRASNGVIVIKVTSKN